MPSNQSAQVTTKTAYTSYMLARNYIDDRGLLTSEEKVDLENAINKAIEALKDKEAHNIIIYHYLQGKCIDAIAAEAKQTEAYCTDILSRFIILVGKDLDLNDEVFIKNLQQFPYRAEKIRNYFHTHWNVFS